MKKTPGRFIYLHTSYTTHSTINKRTASRAYVSWGIQDTFRVPVQHVPQRLVCHRVRCRGKYHHNTVISLLPCIIQKPRQVSGDTRVLLYKTACGHFISHCFFPVKEGRKRRFKKYISLSLRAAWNVRNNLWSSLPRYLVTWQAGDDGTSISPKA